MKSIEKLFFWPGYYSSSLVLIRWDDESGIIDNMLFESDESVLSLVEQGIVTGEQSTLLQYHFNNINRVQVFEEESGRNVNDAPDDIDKVALILFGLLKSIKQKAKEQFGLILSDQLEIVVLDFQNYYTGRELRLVNSLKRYVQHPIDLIDALSVTNTALERGKMGSAEYLMFADEGTNNAAQEIKSASRSISHLDIQSIVNSLLDNISIADVPTNTARYCISKLLKSLKGISNMDWAEYALSDINDSAVQNILVDRLHVDADIKKCCHAMFETLEGKKQPSVVYIVGAFAEYVSHFLDLNDEVTVNAFSRENFIRFLVVDKLLSFRNDFPAETINIFIDGDQAGVLELSTGGSSVDIVHSLKFFGRTTENIIIELNDLQGRIARWSVVVNALTSLDIYELAIHIKADSNYNLDCQIDSTDELYIAQTNLSVYDNDRIRPVQAVNEVISVI